ncbi:uncharacterized protein LOC131667273 isoform X1 [Phymastichus coffea]|uniref:uncharacterized protein LOC131667273 isoform X1 n=1 Tax=Phymastichus coffea TaxID=108790 RepID=UPI00273B8E43|nr:uncharacterized protein LOC131667273 isoform X1 [Phymastichus coffea]
MREQGESRGSPPAARGIDLEKTVERSRALAPKRTKQQRASRTTHRSDRRNPSSTSFSAAQWSLLWKLWLLGLMLLVNTLSLTLFSRALARSASSLAAVAGAAAVNYLCSTVVGWLVFDEPASLLRCTGIMVVLVGLVVMLKANSDTAEAKSSERKRKD